MTVHFPGKQFYIRTTERHSLKTCTPKTDRTEEMNPHSRLLLLFLILLR